MTIGSRDMQEARERAEESLREYAEALKFWNAPDHDHTRLQLRGLVEDVIEETYHNDAADAAERRTA